MSYQQLHQAMAISQAQIIGVCKRQALTQIIKQVEQGLTNLAVNYLQEGLEQQTQLSEHHLRWHFIGRLQTNKLTKIASNFSVVHTVTTLAQATRLAQARSAANLSALEIFIQVNIDQSTQKNGVAPQQVVELAQQIFELDNLRLLGIMVMPDMPVLLDTPNNPFVQAAKLSTSLPLGSRALSMGMSADYQLALKYGATHLRLGESLFGKR